MDDPLFDPDLLDQPSYTGNHTYYAICSTPRTGSNLLCELMRVNGVGVPVEYFHKRKHLPILGKRYGVLPDFIEPNIFGYVLPNLKNSGKFKISNYIEELKKHRTTSNGYFGFKAHWGQFKWLCTECDISAEFPKMKFIYLTREDKVAQAVSFSKASYSKQWNSSLKSDGSMVYDDAHISYCIKTMRKSDRQWDNWFMENKISPLCLEFSSLISEPYATMESIFQFLNVNNRQIVADLTHSKVQSQNDKTNSDWISRYLENHPEETSNV